MNTDINSWKEAKPVRYPGHMYSFRRGYNVNVAGRHENDKEFAAFQFYMNLGPGRTHEAAGKYVQVARNTISDWAERFCWQQRVGAWDQKQLALALKDSQKLDRKKHRKAIEEFRQTNEKQARLMMDAASDLMEVIQARIEKARMENEDIPMPLIAGLLRAAANISETGRQAWAVSLGVNELMQVVNQELEEVQVVDVTDESEYEIPVEE